VRFKTITPLLVGSLNPAQARCNQYKIRW